MNKKYGFILEFLNRVCPNKQFKLEVNEGYVTITKPLDGDINNFGTVLAQFLKAHEGVILISKVGDDVIYHFVVNMTLLKEWFT